MIRFHWALVVGALLPLGCAIDSADHRAFADELTAKLYANPNECSSALGVSMAFSLIYPGTAGEAVDQVRTTLGYPTGSNMKLVWEETSDRVLSRSAGQCVSEYNGECFSEAPLLKIANSIWFSDDDVLSQSYEDVVGDLARRIDFKADNSPKIVNDWVNNSTNGLIDKIVPEGGPLPYVLLAINSLYLKAGWAKRFDGSNTNLDSFYDSPLRAADAKVSDAHFMNAVGYFAYSHEALQGYQVINLPFASSDMSVIFVLPIGEGGGGPVSSADAVGALDGLEWVRVALSLPKFRFESEYDDNLRQSIIELGLRDPFAGGTGALCGIFDNATECENLVISKVIQKTVMDVNEEGVKAAAVTAIGVKVTSIGAKDENAATLMVLDHPFQFFVYDKAEDLVLFEGRLGAPEVPSETPTTPMYDAKHSDGDFWSTRFDVDPGGPLASASSVGISNKYSFSACTCLLFVFVMGLVW